MRSTLLLALGPLVLSSCAGPSAAPKTTPVAEAAEPADHAEEAATNPTAESEPTGESAAETPPSKSEAWDTSQSDGQSSKGDRGLKDYQAIILENRDKFRGCYDQARAAHPEIKGKVTLLFTLDPKGIVQKASVEPASSEIDAAVIEKCLVATLKSLTFPASKRGMESTVRYPFTFNPKSRQGK